MGLLGPKKTLKVSPYRFMFPHIKFSFYWLSGLREDIKNNGHVHVYSHVVVTNINIP